jgi:hypothetical protein
MLTRIHVNQHVIKRNKRKGEREAPLTAKTYKDNRKGHEVRLMIPDFLGEQHVAAKVVYRPDAPLPCGATVWVETDLDVEVDGGEGS